MPTYSPESSFESLPAIRDAIDANGDVITVEMRSVRDAYGADRLGVNVRANISDKLRGLGVGHFPKDLPEYQHQYVRLYKLGSGIARLVDAVLDPSPDHDNELRAAVSGEDREILSRIRELVGQ